MKAASLFHTNPQGTKDLDDHPMARLYNLASKQHGGAGNPAFVPKTDKDGNEIAGIRLPELEVPLATYTGWALRAGPQANDGCEGAGQYVPFAKTKAERLPSGDPRKSVEERYHSLEKYSKDVAHSINKLVKKRLLLCEDVDAYYEDLAAGLTDDAKPGKGPKDHIHACKDPHGPHDDAEDND